MRRLIEILGDLIGALCLFAMVWGLFVIAHAFGG